jgi:N-acyl-D-aspartate/D-glutamate deacylase
MSVPFATNTRRGQEMKKKDEVDRVDSTGKKITRRGFIAGSAAMAASVSLAGGAAGILASCGRGPAEGEYDTLITGGTIYDGTTGAPFVGDIGIRGDRIVAVGNLPATAGRLIDASGLVVAPGFIDAHTHCDLTFIKSGWKKNLAYVLPSFRGNYNYLYQGVTTVVSGNCGYGYTDVTKWLDMVDSVGFGTNVYHLVPHGIVREELFGQEQPTELTASQLELMKTRIREGMEAGAVGMSCGLAYYPGFNASTDELVELSRVAASYGGVFAIHMRDESGAIAPSGTWGLVDSVKEAIAISERAGIPLQISHLKALAPFNGVTPTDVFPLIEEARSRGLDVTADQYPYDAGSTFITKLLPDELVSGESVKEAYRTADGRKEVKRAIGEVFSYLPPDKILISTMSEGNTDYEGKTIAQIAEMENRDPADVYVELVCDMKAPVGIFFQIDMDMVRQITAKEYVFTASDGWTVPKGMTMPHPRCYGTFPRKIREFVLKEKLIDLGGAIRSMTSLPAKKFGLSGRGTIEPNAYADISVIDLDTIGDHATYLDPHQYSTGVKYLLVNGVLSIEGGSATGLRGGRPCRRA